MKLHQFPPALGLPSASPFCTKVATYLRMVDVPYEVVVGDPRRAPKGKLPVLEDGGRLIPDSEAILRYLQDRGFDTDGHLSPGQRALGHAIRRMLEEHLYWVMVYSRMLDEPSWSASRGTLLSGVPAGLRTVAGRMFQKQIRQTLHAQGLGRHSRADIYARGADDLGHLSTLLGDQKYILGEAVSSVDATVYAWLACILIPPVRTPLADAAEQHANLVAYLHRFREKYYGTSS